MNCLTVSRGRSFHLRRRRGSLGVVFRLDLFDGDGHLELPARLAPLAPCIKCAKSQVGFTVDRQRSRPDQTLSIANSSCTLIPVPVEIVIVRPCFRQRCVLGPSWGRRAYPVPWVPLLFLTRPWRKKEKHSEYSRETHRAEPIVK